MQLPSKEQILKDGFADLRVRVGGVLQRHRFTIVREQTAFGLVPYLVTKSHIPNLEMLRVSEGIGLPLKSKDLSVFPKGKMAKDFANL